MANAKIGIDFDPVRTQKVEAALRRIQAQAKGVDFGGGARSLDKLSRPLGKITGQANEFQKSLEASNARVLAFGASVLVINKLSEAFQQLVNNTIKVEAAFTKIGIILDGTAQDLQKFGDGIFRVAQKTGNAFDEVAEGALELARQGLSVEESLSRVETALKLVRVAGIDSQKAVGGLTAAIKNFEGAGLTVAEIADKIAEVDTKFATSTDDLIDGLKRASASAQVAGVSFDELLSAITVVEERTQRGGAVIGNAFKTIFARIRRTDVLDALKSVGIEVLNTEGNIRGAIPLIQDLGVVLEEVGMRSEAAGKLIEKVAGVRQGDILINLIRDLQSGQSQFAKSLQVSAGAFGSLDKKNAEYNKTLDATINKLTVAGQKLAFTVGETGFADAAKNLINTFEGAVTRITDVLDGDTIGGKFARGLIKGIGNVLTGPGLALVGAIFIKLFKDLAVFGLDSLKTLLGVNRAAKEQALLQQSVLQTLVSNQAIQAQILKLEGDKVAQEQLLLQIYNQQAAALQRVQNIAKNVSPGLYGAGLRGGAGGVERASGKASGGYVAGEARDVSRGVGGASPSSKVVSIPNFAFGGGQRGTMIANSSEYYVPNYAGGGDAIFNQNMVKSMGLPSGAKKLRGANGFIPNFALKGSSDYFYNLRRKEANGQKLSAEEQKDLKAYYSKKGSTLVMDASNQLGVASIFPGGAKANTSTTKLSGPEKAILKGAYPDSNIKRVALNNIQVRSLENVEKSLKSERADRNLISKLFSGPTYDYGSQLMDFFNNDERSKTLNAMKKRTKGPSLFSSAVMGGIFESAVRLVTRGAAGITDFDSNLGDQTPFDFEEGRAATSRFNKRFGFTPNVFKADAKRTSTPEAIRSIIGKSIRDKNVFGRLNKTMSAAFGYIPNFADPLSDAIEREKAAGVPINQIRINQSSKVRNGQNPLGLAVTNTRDEPTGAIPNFAAKPGGTGGEMGMDKAFGLILISQVAGGFAQSLTQGNAQLEKFTTGLMNGITTFATLTLLNEPIKKGIENLKGFAEGLQSQTVTGKYGGTRTFRGKAPGVGGALSKVAAGASRLLGPAAIAASVAPLILELTKVKDKFGELNSALSNLKINDFANGTDASLKAVISGTRAQIDYNRSLDQAANRSGVDRRGAFGGKKNEDKVLQQIAKSALQSGSNRQSAAGTGIINRLGKDDLTNLGKIATITNQEGANIGEDILRQARSKATTVSGNARNQRTTFDENRFNEEIEKLVQAELDKRQQADAKQTLTKVGDRTTFDTRQAGLQIDSTASALGQQRQRTFQTEIAKLDKELLGDGGRGVTRERQNQIEIQKQELALSKEIEQQRLGIEQSFAKEVINTQKLNDIQKDSLDSILKQVDGKGTIAELEQKILTALYGEGEATSVQKAAVKKIAENYQNQETTITDIQTTRASQIENEKELLELNEDNLKIEEERLKTFQQEITELEKKIAKEQQSNALAKERNQNVLRESRGKLSPQAKRQLVYEEQINGFNEEKVRAEVRLTKAQADKQFYLDNEVNQNAAKLQSYSASIDAAQQELEAVIALNEERKKGSEFDKDRTAYDQYIESVNQRLAGMSEQMPVTLSQNLENGLMKAMDTVAREGVDGIGKALGDIALDFGREIQRQLMQKAADTLVSSIGSTGVLKNISESLGFASGGMVSGGGGIKDDVPAMLTSGEYVVRKSAVQKYGTAFLDSLNSGSMGGYNKGGPVEQGMPEYNGGKFWDNPGGNVLGGSLSNERLKKALAKEYFTPGTERGDTTFGRIESKEALLAFSMQNVTSGSTDIISSGSVNLETQSKRLSTLARMRDTPERRQLKEAQKQAFEIFLAQVADERAVIEENKQAKKQRDDMFKAQIQGAFVNSLISAGAAGLGNTMKGGDFFGKKVDPTLGAKGLKTDTGFNMGNLGDRFIDNSGDVVTLTQTGKDMVGTINYMNELGMDTAAFTDTLSRRYAGKATGGPIGTKMNAMLTAGEYVVGRDSAKAIGTDTLDDINAMNFQNGGSVGSPVMKKTGGSGGNVGSINITVNVDKSGSTTQTQSTSGGSAADEEAGGKGLAERIRSTVVNVINEEKRVSGSLFTRSK